jgi:hypothetical protein
MGDMAIEANSFVDFDTGKSFEIWIAVGEITGIESQRLAGCDELAKRSYASVLARFSARHSAGLRKIDVIGKVDEGKLASVVSQNGAGRCLQEANCWQTTNEQRLSTKTRKVYQSALRQLADTNGVSAALKTQH